MFPSTQLVLKIAVLTIFFCYVKSTPTCDRNDEDCRDQLMHPELPEIGNTGIEHVLRAAASGENTNEFWRNKATEFVKTKVNAKLNTNTAKNIILFLGDGMGLTTLAAARNLLGGEEQYLHFEQFPFTGLSKTFSVSNIVPDSAGTATAYLCGVKTNSGVLGINAKLPRGTCQNTENTESQVYSIAKWAMDAGKSAGLLTTTRITHASPSGVFAHITERDWEFNEIVEEQCGKNSGVNDIAYQLINGEVGKKLEVMFGGGRQNFLDKSQNTTGYRTDGLNLIKSFQDMDTNNLYVSNRDELLNADVTKSNRILGLFANSHLNYNLNKTSDDNQPSLTEMTQKAIEKLSQNQNGYFLFAEGGRIDHGHHDNQARYALDETVEFAKAIKAAVEATNEEDTLIVVTADHSHSFSYSGYAPRGNDIFSTTTNKASDDKEYMALSYANGPAFKRFYDTVLGERRDPKQVDVSMPYSTFPTTYELDSETHGGEDVPVFAIGPQSHLLTGVYDQNVIPHAMAYASCIGTGLKACSN